MSFLVVLIGMEMVPHSLRDSPAENRTEGEIA